MDLLKAGTSRASRSASASVVAILQLNLCSPGMRSLFNHSLIETNFETKRWIQWSNEAKLWTGRVFFFFFLAFLNHDTKGQGSTNQLKGGLKKGEAISRGTHQHEKVRKEKGQQGESKDGREAGEKRWTCALYVYLTDKCRGREKGGSRVVSGLGGGWEGQVWNPEVKAKISGLYFWM